MRLELATYPVKKVQWSHQTCYCDGLLDINKEELLSTVLEDKKIISADLDIALPGEETRIVNVRDVVEARLKVSGPGCVFPGILGPVETVGHGRTHRLSGMAVVVSATYRPTILSGTAAQNSSIIDMWGPLAKATPFGSTINIVLVIKLLEGVTELEAHAAIQLAEFRIARRLAETTRELSTGETEVFGIDDVDPSLPRVVYIDSFLTNWHAPHSLVAYYGLPIRESLPTYIHPNEYLDGALTKDTRIGSGEYTYTWEWLNKGIVFRLLREHGKRLNFLGVILQRTRFEAEHGKQVTAICTAQMAKLLKAEGVIVTRTVMSGANLVDVMLTVQACEKKGLKTVFLTPEWGGRDGTEPPFVFTVAEADAMVSTGSTDREYRLPAPKKLIGIKKGELVQLYAGDQWLSPSDELTLDDTCLAGTTDWWGAGKYTRVQY
jgi:glycine reductase